MLNLKSSVTPEVFTVKFSRDPVRILSLGTLACRCASPSHLVMLVVMCNFIWHGQDWPLGNEIPHVPLESQEVRRQSCLWWGHPSPLVKVTTAPWTGWPPLLSRQCRQGFAIRESTALGGGVSPGDHDVLSSVEDAAGFPPLYRIAKVKVTCSLLF